MSLGPVVRNVLEQQHAEPPKPHVAQRLFDVAVRDNGLGKLVQRPDGTLMFRPNYAGENPEPKVHAYKEPAYVPFQGDNAYLDPAPMQKSAPKVSADTKSCGFAVGDRVEKIEGYTLNGKHGQVVSVGNFAGENTLLRVKFDQVQEPQEFYARRFKKVGAANPVSALQNGDRVKVSAASPWLQGKSGVIRTVDTDNTCLVQPDGGGQALWICNDYLAKLVAAAPAKPDMTTTGFDPKTSPLQVGDRVKQTRDDFINTNHIATVKAISANGFVTVEWDDPTARPGVPWNPENRDCFEIIERPAK